jgi:uncharacterized protein YdaU (DUF1376 family)
VTELHWFPTYVDKWLSSPAIARMLPEQEGAYLRLLLFAWGNGTEPPTIPTDDESLAAMSRLGKRWAKLGGLVREQFEEVNGRLVNAKQMAVWTDQQARYEKLAVAGRRGGDAKAKRKRGSSDATVEASDAVAMDVANGKQQELEEAVVTSPNGLVLPASAPGGALGVEPPRAPAPKLGMNGHDDGLAARYAERLNELVDLWTAKHPDDAAELERTSRRDMGLPDGLLSGFAAGALRDRMASNIRALNPAWPPQEQWIAQQRVKAMDSQPQATQEVA